MIDTSVIVAGLIGTHVFHERAHPLVLESLQHRVPGIVLAEAWAVMRRAPWNLDVATVAELLSPWASRDRIQPHQSMPT